MGREELEEREYAIRVAVFSVESWRVTAPSLRGALELAGAGRAELVRPERVEMLPEVGECGIMGAEELVAGAWRTLPSEEIRVATQEAKLPPSAWSLTDMVGRLTGVAPKASEPEDDLG